MKSLQRRFSISLSTFPWLNKLFFLFCGFRKAFSNLFTLIQRRENASRGNLIPPVEKEKLLFFLFFSRTQHDMASFFRHNPSPLHEFCKEQIFMYICDGREIGNYRTGSQKFGNPTIWLPNNLVTLSFSMLN